MTGDPALPDEGSSPLIREATPLETRLATRLDHPSARPDITRAVARGATRLLREMGYVALPEMVFANGRRADIVGLSPHGLILVVEVKSGLDDFRVDVKLRPTRLRRRSGFPGASPAR
jgi:hypothetical protein